MNDRGYSKLFSCIVTSSIWGMDSDIRIVWVTMLALKNQYGEVLASVPGLARAANVALEKCEEAITLFSSPDKYSRTKTDDGRRIVEIDGGWRIINNDHYNSLMSLDERREYKRVKEAERRERKRGQSVDSRGQTWTDRGQNHDHVEAHAEGDEEAEARRRHEEESSGAERQPSLASVSEEVVAAWNKLDGFPRCLKASEKRKRQLKARLADDFFLSNWREAMVRMQASSFLRGDNARGWKATFDWFLQPDVCVKIMEGKYTTSKPTTSFTAADRAAELAHNNNDLPFPELGQ